MRNLIAFIVRYNAFFVFLILEVLALYLYFSVSDTDDKKAFLSSANELVGDMMYRYDDWTSYWNLDDVNDSLAQANAQLRAQLRKEQFNHKIEAEFVIDSLYEQQYKYISARVVKNSINRLNNTLTLNRGTRHGVRPNSGVINAMGNGVLGIVEATSSHYASVMSILHKDICISARIKRNHFFGTLVWKGEDTQHMTLEAIPKHAKVVEGDTIVTSGFSSIFPEGILIGTVKDFKMEEGSNFYTIRVALSCDLSQVRYGHIVNYLMRKERLILEKEEAYD